MDWSHGRGNKLAGKIPLRSSMKSVPIGGELFNKTNPTAFPQVQGGSNMTGTDLCVNKPHCAAAVLP